MWLFDLCAADSLKRKIGHHTNTMRHNRRRTERGHSACHWQWCLMLIMIGYCLSNSQIDAQIMMNSSIRYTVPTHNYKGSKYTIDELLNGKFTYKVSDDIDMDPCKASEFMGDIALPNINYDHQWQQQKLNKTFQQELEQLKQEVYHEGLQVEEEGLTDIIRKKTKLPPDTNPISNSNNNNNNEPSKNDAIIVEPNHVPIIQPYAKESIKTFGEHSNIGNNDTTIQSYANESIERKIDYHAVNQTNNENPTIISSTAAEAAGATTISSTLTIAGEKLVKNQSNIFRDIDAKKIQSNAKDIEDESTNILQSKRIPSSSASLSSSSSSLLLSASTSPKPITSTNQTLNPILPSVNDATTTEPTILPPANQTENVANIKVDAVSQKRRRRRHRQQRREAKIDGNSPQQKFVHNTYEVRLKRLKEELNGPTVTEIIQMHKYMWEKNQISDANRQHASDMENAPKQMTNNFTLTFTQNSNTLPLDTAQSFDRDRLKDMYRHHRVTRAATAKKERVWDYGVIPYEIDANFSGAHKALFKQAMKHWENFTCIKFVERNPNDHMNYIIFTIRPCGCCSFVGKRGNGGQAISIGKNCDKFGIVVHELGHVVGFWHEHTRPDRENHVVIERANILNGQEYNFNKLTAEEVNSLGLPYDYDSIMHYARNTFSKGTYLDTIFPVEIKGRKRPEIGQRLRLSEGDIAQANLLYKCSKCGRTFQENSASFASPSYYSSTPSAEPESCEWRITATHGEKIVLNITDLDIFKSNNCRTDYLEIRDGYWHKSPILGRYCGSGRIMELIKSSSSRMLLTLVTTHRQAGLRGFAASYEAVCGGDLTIESGNQLESPNYPLEYLPNKECIWRITVQDDYQVALKFQSFEVENHDNCVYDYVEVRDGDSADSRLIGVFCGYKVPPDMRSTTNKMFVKFVSDGSVQKAGFSATFIKELDECELKDHGCEHNCINTLGGYQCSCHIGYELHSDKKTCENACGGIIEALNGTITSPSFPDVYPVSKDCTWEIVAPEQYRITLNFTHFDLEGNHFHQQECDYDSLTVYSKLDENNLRKHGIFCGERMPPLITSEGNVMRIEFRSDNTVQKSGFAAVFFTDIDECAVNNGGCMHDCKNTIGSYVCSCHNGYVLHDNGLDCKEGGCKYEITAPYGSIMSPNYPDYYPRKKDCVWHFSTTPGHRIRLHFNTFEIEPHQECAYDYVAVYNGDSVDSFTLGKYCGSKLPHPISASSNEMFMVFKSDSSVQRQGFTATHSTACGGHLKATTRVKHFYSHAKFADNNYDHNADCDWTIEAEPGRNVHLTFLTFDIEDEKSCRYDHVDIYGGLDDYSGPLYGRYCGLNKPPDVISMNEALLVRFRSDETMNKKGFSASYVAVDPFEGSEEEISSDSSEMSTPFPGYMKSIYVNSNQLGSRNGGDNTDNSDENTEDSGDNDEEEGYSVYENYNLIKPNNKNKKAEPSENGLID